MTHGMRRKPANVSVFAVGLASDVRADDLVKVGMKNVYPINKICDPRCEALGDLNMDFFMLIHCEGIIHYSRHSRGGKLAEVFEFIVREMTANFLCLVSCRLNSAETVCAEVLNYRKVK